jgi:2-C-methyl-D-erythritol 4-phosphate cytidylyltransferase
MKTIAIVPAAGSGRRLGARTKKPFVLLGGKPLLSYALKALNGCKSIDAIIVASERSCVAKVEKIAERFKINKLMGVVVGGKTRFESVRNCIKKISPDFDIVLIHDAARPFIDDATIERSIAAAKKFGASVAAVRESDTVKLSDHDLFVVKTLNRRDIFRAQTPQVLRYAIAKRAFRHAASRSGVTDDVSIAERIGVRVKIVDGSYRNIKITTKEDIKFAKGLL